MSGTLYRSPSVILDDHEWHIIVRVCHGRIIKQHMFRPLSLVRYKWKPITSWKGPHPRRFWNAFQPYYLHVERASASELRRRDAIGRLERKRSALAASGAKCQNSEILSLPETGVNPVPRGGLRVTCAKMSAEGHIPIGRGRQGFESLTTVSPL